MSGCSIQPLVTRLVNAARSDNNNGYKAGVTLTQSCHYHREAHEQWMPSACTGISTR